MTLNSTEKCGKQPWRFERGDSKIFKWTSQRDPTRALATRLIANTVDIPVRKAAAKFISKSVLDIIPFATTEQHWIH